MTIDSEFLQLFLSPFALLWKEREKRWRKSSGLQREKRYILISGRLMGVKMGSRREPRTLKVDWDKVEKSPSFQKSFRANAHFWRALSLCGGTTVINNDTKKFSFITHYTSFLMELRERKGKKVKEIGNKTLISRRVMRRNAVRERVVKKIWRKSTPFPSS